MKPQSAKAKGRNLQKHVAKTIVEKFVGLHEDDVVSRPMGSGGVDIMMSPLAQRRFPFSIECKNTATAPASAAMEQAAYNCYPNTFPVVAWKPKGKPLTDTVVMIKLEDLISLVNKLRPLPDVKIDYGTCYCGSPAYGRNGSCGPNGCYHEPG